MKEIKVSFPISIPLRQTDIHWVEEELLKKMAVTPHSHAEHPHTLTAQPLMPLLRSFLISFIASSLTCQKSFFYIPSINLLNLLSSFTAMGVEPFLNFNFT